MKSKKEARENERIWRGGRKNKKRPVP